MATTDAQFTVTSDASVTSKYTGLTATPSVSGTQVTLTSSEIGGDSGALLTLGKTYRLAVSSVIYRDALLYDITATTHIFKTLSSAGSPGTTDIVTISLVTEAEKDLTVSGVFTTDSLRLKSIWITDQNYTLTDETVVYAVTSSTNQFDVTFPQITAANHNRVIFVKVDVASGDVDLVPYTGQQIEAGGASTKATKNADGAFMYQANFYAATAPNWELVITSA